MNLILIESLLLCIFINVISFDRNKGLPVVIINVLSAIIFTLSLALKFYFIIKYYR